MGIDRLAENPSRTGFSRWSMAEEPFGSHQSAASLPKWAASSGRIVAVNSCISHAAYP
jgi:hypothetical protein